MMKKIIITFLLLLMIEADAMAGNTDKINVVCDGEKISVTGNGEISENELISFICIDDAGKAKDLNDEYLPYFIEAANADNGEINTIFKIPDNVTGGKYYILAEGKNFKASSYFIYINKEKIENVLDKINSVKSADEMGMLIENEKIDVDNDIYCLNKALANKILYAAINGGYDTERFIKTLEDTYFSILITEGDSKNAFIKYCSDKEQVSRYDAIGKKEYFEQAFKLSDFERESVAEATDKAIITAVIKNADNWRKIRNEILQSDDTKHSDKAEEYFDFSKYDKLNDKNAVFQKMADVISGVDGFISLKELFEKTAKTQYDSENTNKGSSDGSSGGGSSSGGGGKIYSPVTSEPEKADEEKPIFADISEHWARTYIEELSEKGIINGYKEDNTFRPDNAVTRAEMVKMICLGFGISGNGEMNFSDVKGDDWYYLYINSAYSEGIINGKGGYFAPNEPITREDASVILYRLLSKNYPLKSSSVSFIDKSEVSDYAMEAVGAMKNEGIIEGLGKNRFEPKKNLTRAQCAVLMSKCLLRYELTK